jgi:hypothetical protein
VETVKDVWTQYTVFTKSASDGVRSLSLGGLAAVWVFTGATQGTLENVKDTPAGLLLSGVLFASAIALDIAHYAIGSIAYRIYARHHERRGRSGDDAIDVPPWLPGIPRIFFYGKILAVLGGYLVFAWTIWDAWHQATGS